MPSLQNKTVVVLIGLAVIYTWVAIATKLFSLLEGSPQIISTLFYGSILAPLIEELMFRHTPVLLIRKLDESLLIPVLITSSIIFGLMHGHGLESVLRQGAMGLVFSWVYVKNGYSYWSAVTIHALWNTVILFLP